MTRRFLYLSLVLVVLFSCSYYFYVYPSYGPLWPGFGNAPGEQDTTLRPRIHFSPAKNWMNDPNGLFVDTDGTWHMYYQYSPYSTNPAKMSWGHATSEDLYHWTVHDIALHSSSEAGSIFTGSIVIDADNTSGLFGSNIPAGANSSDSVLAVYTQHFEDKEVQAIAPSFDGGFTFEEDFPKNPVINIHQKDFRDPKVIWHAKSKRWIMAVANAMQMFISIYSSPDLITWRKESEFHPAVQGTSYECPNLVRIPVIGPAGEILSLDTYIFIISNGGGSPLNGGSVTRYFPGSFNGTHFSPFDNQTDRFLDFGTDNYAGQFFYDARSPSSTLSTQSQSELTPPILVAWAANTRYAGSTPNGWREGWRGVMTMPRAIALASQTGIGGSSGKWEIISTPVGLDELPRRILGQWEARGDGNVVVDLQGEKGAVIFEGNFTFVEDEERGPSEEWAVMGGEGEEEDNAEVVVEVGNSGGEKLVWGFQFPRSSWRKARFFADRTAALGGWKPPIVYRKGIRLATVSDQMDVSLGAVPIEGEKGWMIKVVMDRSVMEAFLNGGIKVGTMCYFPNDLLDKITIRVSGSGGTLKLKTRITAVS